MVKKNEKRSAGPDFEKLRLAARNRRAAIHLEAVDYFRREDFKKTELKPDDWDEWRYGVIKRRDLTKAKLLLEELDRTNQESPKYYQAIITMGLLGSPVFADKLFEIAANQKIELEGRAWAADSLSLLDLLPQRRTDYAKRLSTQIADFKAGSDGHHVFARALYLLGNLKAATHLINAIDSVTPENLDYARYRLLAEIATTAAEMQLHRLAKPLLEKASIMRDMHTYNHVVESTLALNAPETTPWLASRFWHTKPTLLTGSRLAVIDKLGAYAAGKGAYSPQARNFLETAEVLESENPAIRLRATLALHKLGDRLATQSLVRAQRTNELRKMRKSVFEREKETAELVDKVIRSIKSKRRRAR